MGYINSHPNGGNDSLITYTINKYKYNQAELDLFKSLPHSKSDIVFLGTSLTQGFPLQESFNNAHIKNRGIGGNTTVDILNRLDEVIDGKPQKIFIEIGTNDIGQKHSIDSTFSNLKQIITIIRSKSPESTIYVQSVLPFGKNNSKQIELYNSKVSAYCADNKITFIDLYPHFLRNGTIKNELTCDGTHLVASGYLLWKDLIFKYVKERITKP